MDSENGLFQPANHEGTKKAQMVIQGALKFRSGFSGSSWLLCLINWTEGGNGNLADILLR